MSNNKFVLICVVVVFIMAQISCSLGGFTISREDSGAQPEATSQLDSTEQPASPAQTAPTEIVVVNTPTSEPMIEVPPPESGKSNAVGRILWNGQPVIGTEVKLCEEMGLITGCEGIQFSTTTDEQGYYLFVNVIPGQYAIVVHAIDVDRWLFITARLGLSPKKHTLEAGKTLELGSQHIYKFDLYQISPAEGEQVDEAEPTLRWDVYPDAAYYEVYVSPQNGDSIREKLTSNEFTVNKNLLNCEYSWQVEAFNAQEVKIAEHEGYMHFLVIDQSASCEALLNSPQDGANVTGEGLELSWQAHPLANYYLLYVSDESYNNIVDGVRVNETSYVLTQTLSSGKYKWYISVYDQAGKWIATSAHYGFIVTNP
ncbi:MAG: carboxypeptidase-like regulatory domain-containing protein [Chloroflexi bacterium]|nr:carboxypeptidase-like regulatory domain-containing protein [Chloroflexota bacterium]